LWDTVTKNEIPCPDLREARLAEFSAGTDELVTSAEDTPIIIWNANSIGRRGGLEQVAKLGPPTLREAVAISPNGEWIATVEDNKLLLWKRSAPDSPPTELRGHMGDVNAVRFSPDSTLLVTSSRDQTARIWSVTDPAHSKVLRGHMGSVAWASFHPDGNAVITSSSDGTIRIWDVATAGELATLRWHGEGVNEATFSADGKAILSASDDGSVKLGTCAVCSLSVRELRARVPKYALLPPQELEAVRRD
jgi:WD40 repeat protein